MRKASVLAAFVVMTVSAAMYGSAQAPQGGGAPPQGATLPQWGCQAGPPGRGGGMLAGAGPSDKPTVDAAAADRGKKTYAAECSECHGSQARGAAKGPNLVRAVLVLRDRCGSQVGPFLMNGHPMHSGAKSATLTHAQVEDLAHFLRQRVNDGLRGSPLFQA
jgi:mono/diheme cytochrome c family protein